jgi:hypothetical protein
MMSQSRDSEDIVNNAITNTDSRNKGLGWRKEVKDYALDTLMRVIGAGRMQFNRHTLVNKR